MAGFRLIVVALIAALFILGAESTSTRDVRTRPVEAAPRVSNAAPPAASNRPLRPGTPVRPSDLVAEELADGQHGFALANIGYETYPAATIDGGRTWRTAGPVFQIPIVDLPGIARQSGSAGLRTYFASQGLRGATVVYGTTDAGKHWWQTVLPGGAVYVGAFGGELTAIVAGSTGEIGQSAVSFWAYHSKTGERWIYDDALRPIS